MTSPEPPAAPGRRRRWPRALLVLLVVGAASGLGWYGWRRARAPQPPDVPLGEADAELRQAVEAGLGRARREPYSVAAWGELGKLLFSANYYEAAAVCFANAERLEPSE